MSDLAKRFHDLHHGDRLLLLPNIWDAAGARILEELGYPAVATASAAVSRGLGYEDGEKVPFEQVCWLLDRICASVSVPVTADIEAGYARDEAGLRDNILWLVDTGIVGINFEDTDPSTGKLVPVAVQAARIAVIRRAAPSLFINARTDTFFRMTSGSLEEALLRASAYLDAGASGIYPIGAKEPADIRVLVAGIAAPVNILGGPDPAYLAELQALGVARVSMGPRFQAVVLEALRGKAAECLRLPLGKS
jgi:2-methylisocitrate lyase-like PEP mutase family enzyme